MPCGCWILLHSGSRRGRPQQLQLPRAHTITGNHLPARFRPEASSSQPRELQRLTSPPKPVSAMDHELEPPCPCQSRIPYPSRGWSRPPSQCQSRVPYPSRGWSPPSCPPGLRLCLKFQPFWFHWVSPYNWLCLGPHSLWSHLVLPGHVSTSVPQAANSAVDFLSGNVTLDHHPCSFASVFTFISSTSIGQPQATLRRYTSPWLFPLSGPQWYPF